MRRDNTLAEVAKQFGLHPNQIAEWRKQLLENAATALDGGTAAVEPVDLAPLNAKIGQQALELDLSSGARQSRIAERKAMIDHEHDLSITQQASLLCVSRGPVYYLPRPIERG